MQCVETSEVLEREPPSGDVVRGCQFEDVDGVEERRDSCLTDPLPHRRSAHFRLSEPSRHEEVSVVAQLLEVVAELAAGVRDLDEWNDD
jgi:hypothetical protein